MNPYVAIGFFDEMEKIGLVRGRFEYSKIMRALRSKDPH